MVPYAVPYQGMGKCERLLRKALNNPGGLRFTELCRLAECYGFRKAPRHRGSHVVYKKPGYEQVLSFQNNKGEAKAYQVRELLGALEDLGVIEASED